MAPIEIYTAASLIPTAAVVSHTLAVGYLTTLVGRTIYRSYLVLPPSSATRFREPLRKGHVQTFSLLALASLAVAFFYGVTFSGLSYRGWASQRGVALPENFFGDKGALRGGEHPGRVQIVRWLNDTSFYQGFIEIVADKAPYYFWGQQITLSMVSWSHFLAIEGQRRNIPYLWAFMALAQVVNLSYAQNLFFVTLLLTPIPLPENIKEITRASVPVTSSSYSRFMEKITLTKPVGWSPSPYLQTSLLLITYVGVFLTPFASNTPSFIKVSSITRILLFAPLLLPYMTPGSWGTTSSHLHEGYSSNTTLFRTISTFAACLHFKSTALALFYNTPESHYYHPSLLHPFGHERLSTFNRGSTAVGKLIGAIREHPAVGAAGWDVILSGLSLGIWAAIRGLDAKEMLGSSIPFMKRTKKELQATNPIAIAPIKMEEDKAFMSPTKRRVGRPRKTESAVGVDTALTRRRTKTLVDEDTDYQPTESDVLDEGDEETVEDWEMGALAWGLITTGGLGLGSAAVYGAEIMAR